MAQTLSGVLYGKWMEVDVLGFEVFEFRRGDILQATVTRYPQNCGICSLRGEKSQMAKPSEMSGTKDSIWRVLSEISR